MGGVGARIWVWVEEDSEPITSHPSRRAAMDGAPEPLGPLNPEHWGLVGAIRQQVEEAPGCGRVLRRGRTAAVGWRRCLLPTGGSHTGLPFMTGPAGTVSWIVLAPCLRRDASKETSRSSQKPRSESRWMALVLGRPVRTPAVLPLTLMVRLRASVPAKARRRVALPCSGLARSKLMAQVVAEPLDLPELSVA